MLPLYADIDEVRAAAMACTACERSQSRRQVVFGHGNPSSNLMVVGEAPSGTDDRTGRPFTGPAGDLLDDLLGELGLDRDMLWITNLVRCYAGRVRDGRPENRPVKASEVQACSIWLELEIQYVDPAVLLAIGAPAARSIIDRSFKITEQRGEIYQTRADGRIAIATIQPAYVMRLANISGSDAYLTARDQLIEDLATAAKLAGLL